MAARLMRLRAWVRARGRGRAVGQHVRGTRRARSRVPTRPRAAARRARHVHDMGAFRTGAYLEGGNAGITEALTRAGSAVHPVIDHDPVTGRPFLNVSESFTRFVIGLSAPESAGCGTEDDGRCARWVTSTVPCRHPVRGPAAQSSQAGLQPDDHGHPLLSGRPEGTKHPLVRDLGPSRSPVPMRWSRAVGVEPSARVTDAPGSAIEA